MSQVPSGTLPANCSSEGLNGTLVLRGGCRKAASNISHSGGDKMRDARDLTSLNLLSCACALMVSMYPEFVERCLGTAL